MSWIFFSAIAFADGPKPPPNCVYDLLSGRGYTKYKLNKDIRSELRPLIGRLAEPAWPELKNEYFIVNEHGVRLELPVHYDVENNLAYVSPTYFTDRAVIEGAIAYKASVQHIFAQAIFAENMARHSSAWAAARKPGLLKSLFARGPNRLADLSVPYEELFAELFPMVTAQNPDVMDFTMKFIAQNPVARGLLTHVRNYLWRYYFEPEKNYGKEAEMLAVVFEVLAADIVERAADKKPQALRPEEFNDRLIVKLREKLKDYHR